MPISKVLGVTPKDYYYESAIGNIQGVNQDFFVGVQENLDPADGSITIWDNKFPLTPLSADTEIFISSSNAGDTMSILVNGLDSNFDKKSTITALTGQAQVSVGNFRHVQTAVVSGSVTPSGDIYIAESDTLALGVPTTNAKVKSKILQGENVTHNAFYMVPRAKTAIFLAIRGSTDSPTKPVLVRTFVTPDGGVPLQNNSYSVSLSFAPLIFPSPVATVDLFGNVISSLPEKTFIEYKGLATSVNTFVSFGFDIQCQDTATMSLK